MIYAKKTVGRLLEAAIAAPLQPGDVGDFVQRVRMTVLSASDPLLAVVRMERCPVLSPVELEQYAVLIKRDNPRVSRVAYLLERRGSAAATQFEQLIKEGSNPLRRFFYTPPSLRAFLEPELTPAESSRLSAFLELELATLA
jgi:hypothetical protein